MHIAARVRLFFARRPWAYWLIVAACVAAVAATVADATQSLRRQRDAWGATDTAWVASQPVEVGQPIVATARDYPSAMLPAAAVDADPSGTIARQQLAVGEVIDSFDVAVDGVVGLVPDGAVAITVGQSPLPPVSVGDQVTVYAVGAVITAGVVVATDGAASAVTVAVPKDAAGAVAEAALAGVATVALGG